MTAKRDTAQLLGWERMQGAPMVRISGDRWRPGGINAWFLVGNILVSLSAEGTAKDVLPKFPNAQRLAEREARGLRERPSWAVLRRYERSGHIALSAREWKAVDLEDLSSVLRSEAVVTYDRDSDGRVVAVAYGGGLPMPAEMIRRDLAGPEGPAKAGPKPKAEPGRITELYLETGDVRSVAAALGLSTATVYRHLAATRKENR